MQWYTLMTLAKIDCEMNMISSISDASRMVSRSGHIKKKRLPERR